MKSEVRLGFVLFAVCGMPLISLGQDPRRPRLRKPHFRNQRSAPPLRRAAM